MSRPMLREVFITAAVTGSGETCEKHPGVPKTPKEIADSCIASAKAGAAVVHIHVRDPKTGLPSKELSLYREVFKLIRENKEGVDPIINFTSGMGGDITFSGDETGLGKPVVDEKLSDLCGAMQRMEHIIELRPEICTLDCGSLNWGHQGACVVVNTNDTLRQMAKKMEECGVKPECEVFDSGHLWFVNQMVSEGILSDPPLVQLCMGIPGGAPADVGMTKAMADMVPKNGHFSGFAISRNEMPFVGLLPNLGGNVRVGLEDNLYASRGVLATNEELVRKAKVILDEMGCKVLGPDEVRAKLRLNRVGYKGVPEGKLSFSEQYPAEAMGA